MGTEHCDLLRVHAPHSRHAAVGNSVTDDPVQRRVVLRQRMIQCGRFVASAIRAMAILTESVEQCLAFTRLGESLRGSDRRERGQRPREKHCSKYIVHASPPTMASTSGGPP